jgi:FMN phosphatase YigB (HAD superfamily)
MRYPIVFWDSGGTIFHSGNRPEGFGDCPSPAEVKGARADRAERVLQMFGHPYPTEMSRVIDELEANLISRYDARYSMEVLATELYRQLGITDRNEETLLLADAIAGPRYRTWVWDGVAKALTALHEAGVCMGIIADTHLTARMMRGAMAGVGLATFFGPVICSCDNGVQKPDRRAFASALAALPSLICPSGPVLYVGDHLAKDIDGATAYGWDAALHAATPVAPESKAILTFSDYDDLTRLVLGEAT